MVMSRLLTIEEAAQFLNVSKTSLRRWTKLGTLPCVRVGARRERRFLQDDLECLLNRDPLPPSRQPTTTVGGSSDPIAVLDEAATRGVPRHVSLHHHDRDELWRLFLPYVLHHLERGAPMLYIHEEEEGARADVVKRLRDEGFDADELASRGLLRLLVPTAAYLRTGSFSATRMIDFMESAILDLRALGHSAILVSGEMTWYLSGAEGVEEMIPYEAALNELLRRYPDVTIVCHYDMTRLPGSVNLNAICAHTHVQLPDRIVAGFYRN
jgi:excisionase family DNA binding protein